MKTLGLPLTPNTISHYDEEWVRVIKRHENAVVVYPPCSDREYRLSDFIRKYNRTCRFFSVSLAESRIEDRTDWDKLIRSIDASIDTDKRPFVVFIRDGENLFSTHTLVIPALVDFYVRHANVSLFILSERYPYRLLPNSLMQNIIWRPLYSESDTCAFCTYLEKKFSVTLDSTLQKRISEECGGHLWLVKQVVRSLSAKTGSDPFDTDALLLRVKTIFERLSDDERNVLMEVHSHAPVSDLYIYPVLEKLGYIKNGQITIKLLDRYIDTIIRREYRLRCENDHIYIGKVCIDTLISSKEKRCLMVFILNPGKIITREQIAQTLWLDSDHEYSDWALDQTVSRLRNKLRSLGLMHTHIKTIKGQGYRMTI
jgi:DNA-binding response OmpR family regulator